MFVLHYILVTFVCILHRFVGRFMTRRERYDVMGDRAKKFTNVYVKNFGETLNDDKLRELFETCGPITSCKVGVYCVDGM